jgi:hypothetical protein
MKVVLSLCEEKARNQRESATLCQDLYPLTRAVLLGYTVHTFVQTVLRISTTLLEYPSRS